MKSLRLIAMATLLCAASTNHASDSSAPGPSLEALWEMVQQQQAQITALTEQLENTMAQLGTTQDAVKVTEEQLGVTADYLENLGQSRRSDWASRTTLGGYGELHYNNVSAQDSNRDFNEVDFHRFVTFIGHEFTDRIRFFSEVEIEHSLVKDTDDGSNGGEVELEQAYIEYDLNHNHLARTGLFLVPIGILNETHEPQTFYGVERNDVENIILPTTWYEGGASVSGRYRSGLSWDFAVHSGLKMPTTGGSAFRVRSGRQKVSNAAAESLAYTARLKYTGVPGLELAASINYQDDPSQISDDGLDDGTLVSVHGIYNAGRFTLKGLWGQWNFNGDAIEISGQDKQTGWYIEPSLRLGRSAHDWGFYTRYEDLEGARDQDQFTQFELGFSYWPTERVVVKFDYRERDHDLVSARGRDFDAFDLGMGYQF